MIYIYTEDSSSGFDFVKTIVRRVFKVSENKCKIFSLGGCDNLTKVCRGIKSAYKEGKVTLQDTFVFYIDNYLELASKFMYLYRLANLGLQLYISDYFCFESVFYSYNFKGVIGNTMLNTVMYNEFGNILLNGDIDGWLSFKQKYNSIPAVSQSKTLEAAANAIFVYYFDKLPCILINKTAYGVTLDDALQSAKPKSPKAKCLSKLYYNNGCNRYNVYYCKNKKGCGLCTQVQRSRGTTANLRDLYYNSVLNKPLLHIGHSSNKTLAELWR